MIDKTLNFIPKNKCPRVQRRIECPECNYPGSEAYSTLDDPIVVDPGHKKIRKLHEVPRQSVIRVMGLENQFIFDHIDGMYSVCYDESGDLCHIAAFTEVEVL